MTLKEIVYKITFQQASCILFFTLGFTFILMSYHDPIKDFGNYYYGSKLLIDGKFNLNLYTDIHYFNEQIKNYGEVNFFENYIPVPPFSAIFYAPLCVFKSLLAKLIFNMISLVFFCFSLKKLLRFLNINTKFLLIIPLIFIYPLYNNISQGQSYLLIGGLLIELFIATEHNKVIYPSFLLAIIILLKISPIFLLLYFLLKLKHKTVLYSLACIILLSCITFVFIDYHIVSYYFTSIMPRLFNNDVVGTYYYGNQSLYTALLHLFSYDAIYNTNPIIESPTLIIIIESIYTGIILTMLYSLRKQPGFVLFSFILFAIILLGRYNPTYATFLLFPLAITFANRQNPLPIPLIMMLLTLTVLLKLPDTHITSCIFFVKFARLWGLILLFILCIHYYFIKLNYKLAVLLILPICIVRFIAFPIQPITYFEFQSSKGILYSTRLTDHSLVLKSTLGEDDMEETILLNGKVIQDSNLRITNNQIYYHGNAITHSKDNKLNAFIYNDTSLVFMSDLNQAIRFYKLRRMALHY